MKKQLVWVALFAAWGATCSISAELGEAGPLRLRLELVDGSHLVVTTTLTSFRMHTSLADLDIPVGAISTMEFSAEPGRSSVVLRNGDRLSGDVKLDELPVESLLGAGSLATKHIEKVGVLAVSPDLSELKLPAGLVLYYPFGDTGTVVSDMSGNGRDGSVQGAEPTGAGKSGRALAFAGSDYVQCDDISIGPAVTYAAWIKPDTAKTGSEFYVFRAGRDHETLQGHHYTVELLERRNGGARIRAGGVRATVVDGESELKEARQWYHIAVTVDEAGRLTIYVNGAKDTVGSVTTGEARSLYLGKPGFRGVIDEVMIFDRALTETEVQAVCRTHK